jgi:hypothetical protein
MQSVPHCNLFGSGVEDRSSHLLEGLPDLVLGLLGLLVLLTVDHQNVVEAVGAESHLAIINDAGVQVVRRAVPEASVLRAFAGEVQKYVMNHHNQFMSLICDNLVRTGEVHQVDSGHFSAFRSWVEIR